MRIQGEVKKVRRTVEEGDPSHTGQGTSGADGWSERGLGTAWRLG